MADSLTAAAQVSHGARLLEDLRAVDAEVEAGAREMEILAGLPSIPHAAELPTARLRFSRALRRHLQFVDTSVLPHLRASSDTAARYGIDGYRRLLNEYHEAAAHHVARWPSTSVASDWDGYRRSVADMLSKLKQRIEEERRTIHPLLAGVRKR